ncbi:MAG: hypothetical protein AAFW98_12850 [Pseudomonadota bacterium]
MPEPLSQPRTWTLTLLERELKDAAASPPLSLARMRVLRWLAELEPAEADILWGRAVGLSWTALAAERDGVNDRTIAHRLYLPALERLKTAATLDAFDQVVADCTHALATATDRLDRRFDALEAEHDEVGAAA